MNWWQWSLMVLGVLVVLWAIYVYRDRRTTVSHVWFYIGQLMDGPVANALVLPVLRYQHQHSDYALELYRGKIGERIDDATVLTLSEAWCYPGDFERAGMVLEKHGIDYRVVQPDGTGQKFLLVPGGEDIRKMCRAVMYVFMDAFHLPYTAKLHQRLSFVLNEEDKAHIRKMLALAYPVSQSESAQGVSARVPAVDAPDTEAPPDSMSGREPVVDDDPGRCSGFR
ncbi:MAG: hypothetical protein GXP31_12740 [Kiritimatiellaeota bacterium]|nr:hypothetical protein [Kiritimatiellota bacterium]